MLKIKLIYSVSERKFENLINNFLKENKDKIEIIDIKWKWFFYNYAMIIFKEI